MRILIRQKRRQLFLVFFIAKLYQLLVTSLTAKNHFQPDKITRPWFLIYVFNNFVKVIQNKLQ